MTVIAIKDDIYVKLISGVDYVIEGGIFKVINEKYMPRETEDGVVENLWAFKFEYKYR